MREYLFFCTSSSVSICTFVLGNLKQLREDPLQTHFLGWELVLGGCGERIREPSSAVCVSIRTFVPVKQVNLVPKGRAELGDHSCRLGLRLDAGGGKGHVVEAPVPHGEGFWHTDALRRTEHKSTRPN